MLSRRLPATSRNDFQQRFRYMVAPAVAPLIADCRIKNRECRIRENDHHTRTNVDILNFLFCIQHSSFS